MNPESLALSLARAPRFTCRPGQNVTELARERFGADAVVCTTQDAGERPVIGRVATTWSGPFFGVVKG